MQAGMYCLPLYFSIFSVLEIVPSGLIPFLELSDVKWGPCENFIFKANHLSSCLRAKSNTHMALREKSKVHSMRVCRTSQDLTWQLNHKSRAAQRKLISVHLFFFFHPMLHGKSAVKPGVSFVWGCKPSQSTSSSGPRSTIYNSI